MPAYFNPVFTAVLALMLVLFRGGNATDPSNPMDKGLLSVVYGTCSTSYWRMERKCVFNSPSKIRLELAHPQQPLHNSAIIAFQAKVHGQAWTNAMLLIHDYAAMEQCPALEIQNTAMPYVMETDSVQYCVGDGPCTSVADCLAFGSDKSWLGGGLMESENVYPGYTYCQPFPNVSSCGGGDSCLFFRAYAKPTNTTLPHIIWGCDGWEPRVGIEVSLDVYGRGNLCEKAQAYFSVDNSDLRPLPRVLGVGQSLEQPLAGRGAQSGSIKMSVVEADLPPSTHSTEHLLIADSILRVEELASLQNIHLCEAVDILNPSWPANSAIIFGHCDLDEESFACRVGWTGSSEGEGVPFALCGPVGQQYDFVALDERIKYPQQMIKSHGDPKRVSSYSDLVLITRDSKASRVVLELEVKNVSIRHYIGPTGVLNDIYYEYPTVYPLLIGSLSIVLIHDLSKLIQHWWRHTREEDGNELGE